MITEIHFNWHYSTESGEDFSGFKVGDCGVTQIRNVSEDNSVCYRVDFGDGTAQLIYNPNLVFRSAPVVNDIGGGLVENYQGVR